MESKNIINIQAADVVQEGSLVLSDVNMDIEQGAFVYLIGRVGSGKSSLIKMLNAEIPVVSGKVKVAGYDLRKIKQKEIPFLRRKIGVVFQDFRLLTDRNIHDNLAFVLQATGWKNNNTIEHQIEVALQMVGMNHKLKARPHQLSGGEQQRIVVARALLNNPEIILADEPTGNLDPTTSEDLLRLFIHLNEQGKTIVMATHDYPLIKLYPSKTYICERNRLSEFQTGLEDIDFAELLG